MSFSEPTQAPMRGRRYHRNKCNGLTCVLCYWHGILSHRLGASTILQGPVEARWYIVSSPGERKCACVIFRNTAKAGHGQLIRFWIRNQICFDRLTFMRVSCAKGLIFTIKCRGVVLSGTTRMLKSQPQPRPLPRSIAGQPCYGGAFRKYPLTLVSRNLTSVFFSVPLSIIHPSKRKFSSGLNNSN